MDPRLDRFRQLPALRDLSEDEMVAFFGIASRNQVRAGDRLMAAGEPADAFYLLAGGRLEVQVPQGDGPATPVAQLGPGQLVGEMALVQHQALRQAHVVALEDAVLLRFAFDDFHRLTSTFPELGRKFRTNLGRIVAGRVWSAAGDAARPGEATRRLAPQGGPAAAPEASDAARLALMGQVVAFAGLAPHELAALAGIAYPLDAKAGQPLVRRGDPSDAFYLVQRGHCEVRVARDGAELTVAGLGPGQIFGEMALVYDQPTRTADVVATEDVRVLGFAFEDLRRLSVSAPAIGQRLRTNVGRLAAGRAWTLDGDEAGAMRRRSEGNT